jgi:hypothetical protein
MRRRHAPSNGPDDRHNQNLGCHACAIGAVEGEIDPRLFRKLLWWLNDRIRGNLGVKLSPK